MFEQLLGGKPLPGTFGERIDHLMNNTDDRRVVYWPVSDLRNHWLFNFCRNWRAEDTFRDETLAQIKHWHRDWIFRNEKHSSKAPVFLLHCFWSHDCTDLVRLVRSTEEKQSFYRNARTQRRLCVQDIPAYSSSSSSMFFKEKYCIMHQRTTFRAAFATLLPEIAFCWAVRMPQMT